MKKIQMLLIPLLSLGFLTSCWDDPNPGPEPDPTPVDHTVTEEEYNKACSFEGLEYLQVYGEGNIEKEQLKSITEFSPTIFHEEGDSTFYYQDTFVEKLNDDSYRGAEKTRKTGDYKSKEVDGSDFKNPEYVNVITDLYYDDIESFDAFKYDEKEECYWAKCKRQSYSAVSKLKFDNKVLVNYTIISDKAGAIYINRSYGYEHKTPVFPL